MNELDFEKTYNEFADSIFRHCFFRVSSREVAKDLTQETFVRTWQALEKGKEIENMKAFLYKVATNLIIDYYRKHKEVSLDSLQEKGVDFVKEGRQEVDFMDLQAVLKEVHSLPEKYKQVLMMRYIEDLSVIEIADVIGASENTISVQLHRGIQMLKKNLNVEELYE
ncbi:MAG: RNA polymerase sigma-70 factor, ECF subfamily [Candidatus Doudnabacteria bacterium Gr01-1014_77]|uniref:RNA polymerase sigma-70 factor, ECF subfamily n=1 Tax=Candidatus Doudnabacteria bacterium Gr01-1014_77 TaxID=2017133 RepID=A0A554JA98_9BACT|nr:MAG: RNA polymerase sigma-70 factor, ECF subfamily [Candidatus Doudnabacteria bacterium Gr01-1014_77]